MAIALPNIRRDSTSYNPNKTIGVAFPLDDKNMFFGTLTAKQQAKANLLNCLLTFPGERLMLPEFGVGLKKLLFEQNIDLESLKEKIEKQVEFYLPNLNIREVNTTRSEDEHSIFISITYSVKSTGETDTIQINYN